MFDASRTETLILTDLLKATPREEGGARFVYVEASRQTRDVQGEVVLAKALAAAADRYARYGNLDIDHYSIPSVAARVGIAEPGMWEIGRPVEVRADGETTFVKGEIYKGEGRLAEKANEFWDSLTKLSPPKRWYPSVGGSVLDRVTTEDPMTKSQVTHIRAVNWTNIGFSAFPVNQDVPEISTVPFGTLAKSFGAQGFNLTAALTKSEAGTVMTAGHEADPAKLTGGGALRRQSLDRKLHSYFHFRESVAGELRKGECAQDRDAIAAHAVRHFGVPITTGIEWAGRFLADLSADLSKHQRIS
jgi:hypothetical protein